MQSKQSKVQFSQIGLKEDLVIHAVGDASYRSDGPSIGGSLIMLGAKTSSKVNPLYWKSKQIQNTSYKLRQS